MHQEKRVRFNNNAYPEAVNAVSNQCKGKQLWLFDGFEISFHFQLDRGIVTTTGHLDPRAGVWRLQAGLGEQQGGDDQAAGGAAFSRVSADLVGQSQPLMPVCGHAAVMLPVVGTEPTRFWLKTRRGICRRTASNGDESVIVIFS